MRNFNRFALAALAVVALGAVASAATGLNSRQLGFVKAAIHDNDLARWADGLWNNVAQAPGGVVFTIGFRGSPTANARHLGVQFTDNNALGPDSNGRAGGAVAANVAYVVTAHCWLSDFAAGNNVVTTGGTSALAGNNNAAGTSGGVFSVVSGKDAEVVTTATGVVWLLETQTASVVSPQYLCCGVANSGAVCSAGFTP
jgi:hypothetical protein